MYVCLKPTPPDGLDRFVYFSFLAPSWIHDTVSPEIRIKSIITLYLSKHNIIDKILKFPSESGGNAELHPSNSR